MHFILWHGHGLSWECWLCSDDKNLENFMFLDSYMSQRNIYQSNQFINKSFHVKISG